MNLYHSTARENRDSILLRGLLARDTAKHNYDSDWIREGPNNGVLAVYASTAPNYWGHSDRHTDVWEIDTLGLPLDVDPVIHNREHVALDNAVAIRILADVPPERLRLTESEVPF